MKNSKCPIFSSTELYTNPDSELRASGRYLELIDNELELDLQPYVCTNCGFVALHIVDTDELKSLPHKSGWKHV
jgi:hypothetical protein